MKPQNDDLQTFGSLLERVRAGFQLQCSVLVELESNDVGYDRSGPVFDQTQSLPSQQPSVRRYGEEYARCPVHLVSARGLPGPVGLSTSLGRSGSCDVRLRDASVSKRHARIQLEPTTGEYLIVDEGSRNGTYVDGAQIADGQNANLWTGTHVSLGDAHFVFIEPATLRLLATLDGAKS